VLHWQLLLSYMYRRRHAIILEQPTDADGHHNVMGEARMHLSSSVRELAVAGMQMPRVCERVLCGSCVGE
jgi:hypothetical protein